MWTLIRRPGWCLTWRREEREHCLRVWAGQSEQHGTNWLSLLRTVVPQNCDNQLQRLVTGHVGSLLQKCPNRKLKPIWYGRTEHTSQFPELVRSSDPAFQSVRVGDWVSFVLSHERMCPRPRITLSPKLIRVVHYNICFFYWTYTLPN